MYTPNLRTAGWKDTNLKDKSVGKVGGSKHHRRPLVGVLEELHNAVRQPLKGSGAEVSLSDEHSKPELQPHPPEDRVPVDLKRKEKNSGEEASLRCSNNNGNSRGYSTRTTHGVKSSQGPVHSSVAYVTLANHWVKSTNPYRHN